MDNTRKVIKDFKILRDLSYEQVRDKIMSRELSVNTVVKVFEKDRMKVPHLKLLPLTGPEKNFFEYTILHLALHVDDDNFVDFLLENNADTKLKTKHLAPVILWAISLNRLKYVKKLVTAGAIVNQVISVEDTYESYCDRLNNEDHYNDHLPHDEYTPLEFAVNLNAYEIAEFLISQGADVHGRDFNGEDSPMGIAALANNVEMLKLLIKHGANINAGDINGVTPLMKAAIENDNLASRRFLLSQPVIEINSLTNDKKRSCLHFPEPWYIEYQTFNPESSLYDLLDAGCDINIVSDDGKLPIDSYEDKILFFEVMKMHIVKLMAAGFYVCDGNKKVVSGSKLRNFRVKCDMEVEVMKNTNGIMAGFSLLDILHRSYHKLALRIKDGDENKFDDKMAAKFPLYAGMIKYRLEKAGQRRKLFNQVENILYEVFSRYLPATFIHEMFFYFSNSELTMNNTREEIKNFKIFRDWNYEQVRNIIMAKELSVNTVVKIYKRDRIKISSSKFLPPTGTCQSFFEYTILHLALYVDDDEFVDFLLENNADTKLETEHLAAVILAAISMNCLDYVKKLVAAGADVNQIIWVCTTYERDSEKFNDESSHHRYYDEYTPLEFAVNLNTYEIAEFLISQGAEVHRKDGNGGDYDDSPIHIAASCDNVEMLKLLIKHGADVNAGNNLGLTPLMKAAADDYNPECLRLLLSQSSIEINSLTDDNRSCLHFLGALGIVDIDPHCSLQDLLDAGCDVNIVSDHGELPIDTYGDKETYREVMKKHIVKLMAAGFYICDKNKEVISGSEFRKFRVECDTEVEVMKNTHGIMAGFSLFDILHRSYHKLALRIKDGDEDKFDDKMAAKFPLYAGMIKYRLEKAGQRRILFNQVENILYKIFSRYLPATFIHEINFELIMANCREIIKDFIIYRNLSYKDVRDSLMSNKLPVDIEVKIYERDRIKIQNLKFLPRYGRRKEYFKYTILHVAPHVDDEELVDFLLKNNILTKLMGTEDLKTVILSVMCAKNLKYIKKLVTAGADVNQIIDVKYSHNKEQVDWLHDIGYNYMYHIEYTPLECAVNINAYEIAKFLISQGANVHGRDENDGDLHDSPMAIAASSNNVKMIELLIENGADINIRDDNGLTPLIKAALVNSNSDSRRFLLSQPVIEINSLTNNGNSCLHFPFIWNSSNGDPVSSLEDLLDAGCDINIVNSRGKLPIDTYKDKRRCREVMKKHIVKLMAADFYVCDRNKAEAVSESELENFRVECDGEVEVMKNTYGIMAEFSLFNILHKPYHQMALKYKDGDEDKFDDKMAATFPLYAGMIKYRLEKAGQRRKLFDQAEIILNQILSRYLPATFIYEINFELIENVLYKIYSRYLPATFIHEMFFYFIMNNTREEIKTFKIFRQSNYEQVREKIMSKEFSVNTVVKIYEKDRTKISRSRFLPLTRDGGFFFEYSILHLAVYLDDDNFVDFLLENNADTKLVTIDSAPVILSAIGLNRLKYVKKLVTAGAIVNQVISVIDTYEGGSDCYSYGGYHCFNYTEYTPLEFAVSQDSYEVAEFLISQGADVHGRIGNDGESADSPMGIAVSSNNLQMIKLLIKHGADIIIRDENGLTPLMKAALVNSNSASRRFLLSHPFIEINSLTDDKSFCLHFPDIWDDTGDPASSLEDLLDAGCDINIVNSRGELPIDTYKDKRRCREVMKKHIVKLMAADFYVCDRNKAEAVSESELENFRVECDGEVEVMKNTYGIMAKFSLFDILHISYHKLALRIKDGDEDKFDDKMAAKFPLYAGMIKYRLEKAGQRRKLFNQVANILYKILSRYLPATFIYEINFELIMDNLREQLKEFKIFRKMSYEDVRDSIMSNELCVNTVVKIYNSDRMKIPISSEFLPPTKPNEYFFEYTILHLALYVDDEEFVDFLLKNNADTKLETEHLALVILSAIRLNRLKYVKKLVAAGANINQSIRVKDTYEKHSNRLNTDEGNNDTHGYYNWYTPLEFAVNLNAYEIAEFLISQGANVHGEDYSGEFDDAPMSIAAASNNVEMIKLLMKHGADINVRDINGLTPLMKAALKDDNSASLRFLLSQPFIKINSLTRDKCSCLHFPEPWYMMNVPVDPEFNLQDLLDAGCNVNILNSHCELPIDTYEEKENCLEVMKKHIVKLMAAGFYVCDRNKEAVLENELRNFRVECDTEVEVMKNTYGIMAEFSLFDILHISYHKLALRIKNGDEDKFDDKMAAKFPLYAGMIKYRLEKAGQRRKLFKQVENILYEVFSGYLPDTFIHEMFFYFSNFELSKLEGN
ncbi:Similar to FPV218: Putative ankyrin repeat protein FPV218 (Fowlpox virus (strain NVSL)) [Cotesia congregata]|uniref:Similar to FPV218: Putative ankyrin repeat protein FPV218 (Fowlpox virus (Strain NVSL)) n=1 Tax=Cotesia congregata TaxID=51543 RepID=A0A8J2H873_COTCN|nr:Similar to FPV218: Putative ankyrin repeat protein FPV218 (Fowlpox virus (strain NVSL)) [Cotesia congregata]